MYKCSKTQKTWTITPLSIRDRRENGYELEKSPQNSDNTSI